MLPIPGLIAKRTHTVQENRLKRADARIQSVTEGKFLCFLSGLP